MLRRLLLMSLVFSFMPIASAEECQGLCMSDVEKENQLWLATIGKESQLQSAFEDSEIAEMRATNTSTKCSQYLERKLSSMPLGVATVEGYSSCEIVSDEAEWDLKIRIVEMEYPGLLQAF